MKRRKGYAIVHNEDPVCYAKGSRGISCDSNEFGLWNFQVLDGKKEKTLRICRRHYDIVAKLQGKPNSDEVQRKRIAGTKKDDDIVDYFPDRDWWERVALPSYRTPW